MEKFATGILPQKRQVETDVNKEKSGRKKTRKYNSSSLNFDFTDVERKGVEHPAMCDLLKI